MMWFYLMRILFDAFVVFMYDENVLGKDTSSLHY